MPNYYTVSAEQIIDLPVDIWITLLYSKQPGTCTAKNMGFTISGLCDFSGCKYPRASVCVCLLLCQCVCLRCVVTDTIGFFWGHKAAFGTTFIPALSHKAHCMKGRCAQSHTKLVISCAASDALSLIHGQCLGMKNLSAVDTMQRTVWHSRHKGHLPPSLATRFPLTCLLTVCRLIPFS